MNKKKLIAMITCLVLIVAIAVGGSLAYFKDEDSKDNVFTVGDITIDLWENFNEDLAHLMPTTGKDENGNIKNAIEKEVFVTNTGTDDAFVRVHIAIPTALDNGNPEFNAGKNALHFNYASENIGTGKWDWTTTTGAPYEGKPWNYYETTITETIDGEEVEIDYNVYVVTYEKALVKGETTVNAIHQVYLDAGTTNKQVAELKKELGDEWHIHVVAEGVQAVGFDDAYTALNTAFGVPGTYEVNWVAQTFGPQDLGKL